MALAIETLTMCGICSQSLSYMWGSFGCFSIMLVVLVLMWFFCGFSLELLIASYCSFSSQLKKIICLCLFFESLFYLYKEIFVFLKTVICACVCLHVCLHVCVYVFVCVPHSCSTGRDQKRVGYLGIKVTGLCELHVGDRNWTLVLWKTSCRRKFLSCLVPQTFGPK